MNNIIQKLMKSSVVFLLLNFLLYLFYGLLIGLSAFPSICLIYFAYTNPLFSSVLGNLLVTALSLGCGVYLFFLAGLLLFGLTERLLSLGFKPGEYAMDSGIVLRWIIYSGVHTIALSMILPYVLGSGFARIYYKIVGCKVGKNVFINSVGLHDSYLLEIGDNVVIGGGANINCHIFEGNKLILGRVVIENDVLIGANAYIMPDTTINHHTSIGVGAILRRGQTVETSSVIMSMPGIPIRQLSRLLRQSQSAVKTKKMINEDSGNNSD